MRTSCQFIKYKCLQVARKLCVKFLFIRVYEKNNSKNRIMVVKEKRQLREKKNMQTKSVKKRIRFTNIVDVFLATCSSLLWIETLTQTENVRFYPENEYKTGKFCFLKGYIVILKCKVEMYVNLIRLRLVGTAKEWRKE